MKMDIYNILVMDRLIRCVLMVVTVHIPHIVMRQSLQHMLRART